MVYEIAIQYECEDVETAEMLADKVVDEAGWLVGGQRFICATYGPKEDS